MSHENVTVSSYKHDSVTFAVFGIDRGKKSLIALLQQENLPLAGQKKDAVPEGRMFGTASVVLKTTYLEGYHRKSVVAIRKRTVRVAA